jgi:integrase
VGELLALKWDDITDAEHVFWETKNGRTRRLPVSPDIRRVLDTMTRTSSRWVLTNRRTHQPFTVNGLWRVFKRALRRAGIPTADVNLHTLRHTALSRMVASGYDDFTVMAISGHSSTRMLERYAHPTLERKADALTLGDSMGRTRNRGVEKA